MRCASSFGARIRLASRVQGTPCGIVVSGVFGGDEFALLLWNVGGPAAAAKAAALETAVYSTPVRWQNSTLVVGASAGVAPLGALDSAADVLARADAAMYARKAERKDGLLRHSGSRAAAIRNP